MLALVLCWLSYCVGSRTVLGKLNGVCGGGGGGILCYSGPSVVQWVKCPGDAQLVWGFHVMFLMLIKPLRKMFYGYH